MSDEPRKNSLREALVSQALIDLDELVSRIEHLPELTAKHEAKAVAVATALSEAADKYLEASRQATKDLMANMLRNVHSQSMNAVESAGSEARSSLLEVINRLNASSVEQPPSASAQDLLNLQKRQERWNWIFAGGIVLILLISFLR